MISFEVLGEPAPKGSMRAMLMKGRPIMIPGGSSANQKALKAWDKAIKQQAELAIGGIGGRPTNIPLFSERGLEVGLLFKLVRPKSHFGAKGLLPKAPPYPITKPDIDKLARAVLDSLTDVVWDDDSRIAVLTCEKQWSDPSRQGVVITIRALEAPVEPRGQRQQTLDLTS